MIFRCVSRRVYLHVNICRCVYILSTWTTLMAIMFVWRHVPEDYTSEKVFVFSANGHTASHSGKVRIFSTFYDHRLGEPVIRIFAVSSYQQSDLHCCISNADVTSWTCLLNIAQKVILRDNSSDESNRNDKFHEVMYVCHDVSSFGTIFEESSIKVSLVDSTVGNYGPRSVVAISAMDRQDMDFVHESGFTNSFSVCVIPKSSTNKTASQRRNFIEFVVSTQLLGADIVFLYGTNQAEHYVMPPHTPVHIVKGDFAVEHRISYHTLLKNDCLYRSRNKFEYVLFLDEDEILVPTSEDWTSLLISLHKVHNTTLVGGYVFRIFSFYDDTTNRTSKKRSKSKSVSTVVPGNDILPRAVRFRLRDAMDTKQVVLLANVNKVDHVTGNNMLVMLPGHSFTNVPVEYGTVHRFSNSHKRLRGLVIDSSKDKLVPKLLRQLHSMSWLDL